jgi:flagellar motor switch protein FliN/FliY
MSDDNPEGIDVDALIDGFSPEVDDSDSADEWGAVGDSASGDVEVAPLEQFQGNAGKGFSENNPNLEVILDIPVTISMEVGATKIPIRNLLQLNQGSVIELDRLAGEPLDVLVNGRLIAHGEVVMVNEKFGIRLTDVVSQQERIQKLS